MSSFAVAALVFACTFLLAIAGMLTRKRLPEHHLSQESKSVVQLCMGLIATLTALTLSLVLASAKQSFDSEDAAVRSIAASVLVLDRTLERFGPETQPIRDDIRSVVASRFESIWRMGDPIALRAAREGTGPTPDTIEDAILALSPKNDAQRWLRSQALAAASDVLKTRFHAFTGAEAAVPTPFLVVIVFWLSALFWSFGLFAPSNRTVVAVLMVASTSVAASLLLILEMETPFSGLLRISGAPLRHVLESLGQ